MFRAVKTAAAGLIAVVILATGQQAGAAPFLGEEIETLSAFDGVTETRTDTVVDPAIEIQHGDGSAFSWMIAGDFIDFTSNAIVINFDPAHDDLTGKGDMHFEFTLTSGNFWDVSAMAIVKAINVNLISGSVAGDTFSLDIFDPENADEFGGLVEVRVNNITDTSAQGEVPLEISAPATLPLLTAGLIALAALRRRPRP